MRYRAHYQTQPRRQGHHRDQRQSKGAPLWRRAWPLRHAVRQGNRHLPRTEGRRAGAMSSPRYLEYHEVIETILRLQAALQPDDAGLDRLERAILWNMIDLAEQRVLAARE